MRAVGVVLMVLAGWVSWPVDLWGQEERFPLSAWQSASALSSAEVPEDSAWQDAGVPGCIVSVLPSGKWFRGKVDVPAVPSGHRAFLRFGRIRYVPVVRVNGQVVLDGSHPQPVDLPLDVTSRVLPGPNEVEVHVRDWTGAIPGHGVLSDLPAGDDPRTRMFRRIPFPLTSDYLCMGVLDDAYIVVVPEVAVTAVWADTRLLQGQVMVRVELTNRTEQALPLRLAGLIRTESGTAVTSFSREEFFLYPGVSQVSIPVSWVPGHLWSVDDPTFHRIEVDALQGATSLTRSSVRVGLREVRLSGNRILLNGSAMTLLVKEGFVPMASCTREDAVAAVTEWKDMGFNTLLMGGGIWPSIWLEAADEMGMLVVASMPLPCDGYLVNRTAMEGFRLNSLDYAEGLLRQIMSHPSVFAVALTRGLLRCASAEETVYYGDLVDGLEAKLTSHSASLLPLFLEEPGLAGRGAMDWVDVSGKSAIDWLGAGGSGEIFVGEGVNPAVRPVVLTGVASGPSEPWQYTVYRGMVALYDMVGNRSYAESVALAPMLGGAIRSGVSGWASRTDTDYGEWPGVDRWLGDAQWVTGAAQDPLLVAPGSVPAAFTHGKGGTFTVQLTAQGTAGVKGSVSVAIPTGELLSDRAVSLSPGQALDLPVTVSLPAPPAGFVSYPHQASVTLDGREVSSFPVVSVAAEPVLKLEGRVGVFDPAGVLDEVFDLGAAERVTLSSLFDDVTEDLEMVVVAPGAMDLLAGPKASQVYTPLEQHLLSYVFNGGNLLVMEQTTLDGVLPFVLERQGARALFGDTGSHVGSAVGRGILASPYQQEVLADYLIRVPDWGTLYCAVRGETTDTDRWCALLEVRRGQGRIVLFQLPLSGATGWSVLVRQLLARSIEYLRLGNSERPQVAVGVGIGAWWPGALDLPVQPSHLPGTCATVAIAGQEAWLEGRSVPGLQPGGLSWIHVTDPQGVSSELGADATWDRVQVLPVFPAQTKDHGDFADLYSRFQEAGILAQTPVSAWYAGGSTSLVAPVPGDWHAYHQPLDDPHCIPAGGRVHWTIDLPVGGPYEVRLTLDARPVVDTEIAGHVVSGRRSARFRLDQGVHEVRVGFPDVSEGDSILGLEVDYERPDYLAGVPAQLCVQGVSLVRGGFSATTNVATLPAFLAEVPAAESGKGILDGWSHQVSGRSPRHLGVLSRWLGRQGVVVDSPLSLRIPASAMEVVGSKLTYQEGDRVWLRDNGSLDAEVEFPRTGTYRFLVTLTGTPVQGSYPLVRILVDGAEVGTIPATRLIETVFVDGAVASGRRTVSLVFEDDALVPPEDRDVGFVLLEVAALRGNQAPWVTIETEFLATQVQVSAGCLWDPDGDEVSVRLAVRRDACPGASDDWQEGDTALFTVEPFQWYYAGAEVRDGRQSVTRRCAPFRFVPDSPGTGDDSGGGDATSGDALVLTDAVGTDVGEESESGRGGGGGCQQGRRKGSTDGLVLLLLVGTGVATLRRRRARFSLP